jgi:hypothetical protein
MFKPLYLNKKSVVMFGWQGAIFGHKFAGFPRSAEGVTGHKLDSEGGAANLERREKMFGKKRDRTGTAIRAYEFGAEPIGDTPLAGEQLYRRNKLWNQFVEIERDIRAKYRELVATDATRRVTDLVAQLDELRQQIRRAKKDAAYQHVSDAATYNGLREQAKLLRELLLPMRAEAKIESRARHEQVKMEREQLETGRTDRVKAAMAASGLYWCNSDDVRASYEVARKRAMKDSTELRFHRFDGGGKLSVRYQNGLPVAEVFGSDTRLQIDPIDFALWESAERKVRRRCQTGARLRIGSNEKRQPVWIALKCWLDGRPGRHLPMDGTIRSAAVVRRRVGTAFIHRLILTVEAPVKAKSQSELRAGTIGIDVGWRLIPDNGLRIAYWSNGEARGEVALPARIVAQFEKVHDLESIRSKNFNAIIGRLQGFLEENGDALWLHEQCQYIAQWRSPGRLIHVLNQWQPIGSDSELLEHLHAWRQKEDHLYAWQANLLDQAVAHRRELYRIFASSLGRYAKVAIEEFDLRKVLQKPRPEDGAETPDGHMRTIAAVSTLRNAIQNYCQREGVEIVFVPAAGTTRCCHICHSEQQFDQRSELIHRCTECNNIWDQDYNAAENIRMFADRPGQGAILESSTIEPESPAATA